MKRGTKKITSLALALTMCLSSLAGSAFAAEPETELMVWTMAFAIASSLSSV